MQSDIQLPEGWVLQDKVPARVGIDRRLLLVEGEHVPSDIDQWWDVLSSGDPNQVHGSQHRHAVTYLICRVDDYPEPVESPDDWVPLTDPHHVLRRDIDWIRDRYAMCPENYEAVNGYTGENVSCHSVISARCLRKHHPDYQAKPVEPQSFRKGDLVRFRGGMISFLVAWVAKDGMVRLADHSNPAYWCNPDVLELVSRAEGSR